MRWNVESRKISDLIENPKNPRHLKKEQADDLKESIEKFGLCEPIVVNTDNFIIGGHQRIHTLKLLGHEYVDVNIPERQLTEKEVEELTIRLNKNVGEWDDEILANEWDPNELCKWGFTEAELHCDLDVINGKEPEDSCTKCEMCGQKIKQPKKKKLYGSS